MEPTNLIPETPESPRRCPHCNYNGPLATGVTDPDATPQNGDVSICINCAEISIYDNNGATLRKMTDAEEQEMSQNSEVVRAKNAAEWVIKKYRS